MAAIFYTGGTTGLPKGALLTHRNLTANALHVIGMTRLTWRDRYLYAAPQFHIADGALAYSLTWVGGTHVFVPAFDPRRVVEALEDEAITVTLLVPTMITMCVASGVLADADLSAMRLMIYGASPMPAEVQRMAVPAFGCDFMQAYGMTEAAPVVSFLDGPLLAEDGAQMASASSLMALPMKAEGSSASRQGCARCGRFRPAGWPRRSCCP